MTGLFDAIEARFNASPTLRLKGRKLYEGFGDVHVSLTKPFTEVDIKMIERLDAFDADVEKWSVEFRYHAKDVTTAAAEAWVEAITEAYKDANIRSGRFATCGCRMMSASPPTLDDGAFNVAANFELIVQRARNLPQVRGA